MVRLDVYRINAKQYALDCQSDLLAHLETRFVVPLLRPLVVPALIATLHPMFDVVGETVVMATHLAGSLPVRRLRDRVASLADFSYEVQRALDTLMSSV